MFDVERSIFLALCRADTGRLAAENAATKSQAVLAFLKATKCVHNWHVEIVGEKIRVKYTEPYALTWREAEWLLESLRAENAVIMDVMLS